MEDRCYWTAGLKRSGRPSFNWGTLEEVMCVHEGMGADGLWQIHVEISDIRTHPETWGVFLSNVAQTIAGELAEANGMSCEEAERCIRRAFTSGNTGLAQNGGR
jgi:hypothetical protein